MVKLRGRAAQAQRSADSFSMQRITKTLVRFALLWSLALGSFFTLVAQDQNRPSPKQFEKMVLKSSQPLFVDGERVYRGSEVTTRVILTLKPEPVFTDKARKKKTQGLVEFRVIFTASGEVKVVNVLKRLPNGLTEEALKAAARIQFEPAVLDGNPVSQTMLLQYSFNR